jgi:hypothetical protein
MDISLAEALVVEETRTRMASLVASAPIRDKAENLCEISRLFQALAICKLITAADVLKFRESLVRSAQARRYYLRKSRAESSLDDRFLALSRVQAIFDAVVAGDDPLARDVALLSLEQWHDTWEYEDDFCYYLFVHRLVVEPTFVAGEEAAALLARFARALEGKPSVRLELCEALMQRQAEEFRAAFEELLAGFAADNEGKRAKATEYTAGARFWPASFVSVEALAWLRLAARFGIEPADRFEFCPDEARRADGAVSVPDLFAALDQALKER